MSQLEFSIPRVTAVLLSVLISACGGGVASHHWLHRLRLPRVLGQIHPIALLIYDH